MNAMEFELTPEEKNFQDRTIREERNLKDNPHQSLGTHLEKQALERPNKPALFFGKDSWTWYSVNAGCNKYASLFKSLNLRNGDTVSIMMEKLNALHPEN